MLEDYEGVRKNMKIFHLENKMRKNGLVASPALREGRILGEKLGIIKKFQKIP
jgi:hypothetical protein